MPTRLYCILWLAYAIAYCAPATAIAADTPRPNIVFFFADDQRYDTLGCAGHPIIQTPAIDELARNGVRFERMFVSHPICWVSRTSVLTGQTARTFGQPHQPDAPRPEALREMYPDLLRSAGYRVGFFGKWHAFMPQGFKPAAHFDEFEAIRVGPYFKKLPSGELRHETDLIGDRAEEFLAEQPRDKPFCLSLWFNAAHADDGDHRPGSGHYPWPPSADDLYVDTIIPPPRLGDPKIYESQPDFLKKSLNRERFFWGYDTPEKFTANMRGYFRMISGIDHVVERVRTALAERGFAENTIIIYSADNGYYMGDRGFQGKWSHYEQSLHVPLVIYDPRLAEDERGRAVKQLALNLDVPATLLDWAGVNAPESYQGRSLRPIVEGKSPADWRTDIFCEHVILGPNLTWEGVRGERYKYARYFDQQPAYEFLHDLERDPDELVNLASDEAHAATLAEMRRRCDALVKQHGGPLLPFPERNKR